MANFEHPKPGGWTLFDLLLHDEMNLVAEQLVKAPNADDGSTHAPSMQHINILGTNGYGVKFDCPVQGSWTTPAAISIAGPGGLTLGSVGSPLPVVGYVDVATQLTFSGAGPTFSTGFDVTGGTATFETGTTLNMDGSTLSMSLAELDADATLLHLTGGSVLDLDSANVYADNFSGFAIDGLIFLTGALGGDHDRTGKQTLDGDGARTIWRRNLLADGTADIDSRHDTWRVRGTLTANRVYTVRHTGSYAIAPGERVLVYRTEDPGGGSGPDGNTATLKREDGTTIFIFAATHHGSILLENDGTKIVPIPAIHVDAGSLTGTGLYGN